MSIPHSKLFIPIFHFLTLAELIPIITLAKIFIGNPKLSMSTLYGNTQSKPALPLIMFKNSDQ